MECLACVLAFVPHDCRAAADGGSWAECASELRRRRARSDAGSGGLGEQGKRRAAATPSRRASPPGARCRRARQVNGFGLRAVFVCAGACACWPSRRTACAGTWASPCRGAARTGYQAAAPGERAGRAERGCDPGFDPWLCAGGEKKREPSRRDAPATAASCPATGTTRRPPRAGARVRTPGRQAHPSAEPRRVLQPEGEGPGREALEPSAGGAPRGRGVARPCVEHVQGEG
jgi:hypothetical protein